MKRATSLEDRLFEETKRAEALANVVPAGEERDLFLKKIRQANSAAHTSWLTSPGLKSPAVFCGTQSCSPFWNWLMVRPFEIHIAFKNLRRRSCAYLSSRTTR